MNIFKILSLSFLSFYFSLYYFAFSKLHKSHKILIIYHHVPNLQKSFSWSQSIICTAFAYCRRTLCDKINFNANSLNYNFCKLFSCFCSKSLWEIDNELLAAFYVESYFFFQNLKNTKKFGEYSLRINSFRKFLCRKMKQIESKNFFIYQSIFCHRWWYSIH